MNTGIREAQVAVHCVPDVVRVAVLLPIVLPPANGAQRQRARRIQSAKSTARATKAERCGPHARMDELFFLRFTKPERRGTAAERGWAVQATVASLHSNLLALNCVMS